MRAGLGVYKAFKGAREADKQEGRMGKWRIR